MSSGSASWDLLNATIVPKAWSRCKAGPFCGPRQLLESTNLDDRGVMRWPWSAPPYLVLSCSVRVTQEEKKTLPDPLGVT